jgi:proteasome lid subunit RPN8/RPN11
VTAVASLAMAGLSIPDHVARELLAHARAVLPNEACGLLAGDPATGRATTYHPARNAHASALRYDVHPEDLVRIVFAIESAGDELVAIFHSHTRTPAVPSAADLRDAAYPVLHLLAGLGGAEPVLRAWRIEGGSPSEVPLRIG